jgi:hypothetical protein
MEEQSKTHTAAKPVTYRRRLVRELINRLTKTLDGHPEDNMRVRVEYVLKILEKSERSRPTIMLPSPGGIEEIEQHLGIPEIAEDSREWNELRREAGTAPPADYELSARPPEPPLKPEILPQPQVRQRTLAK